jgi:hypothetical protein
VLDFPPPASKGATVEAELNYLERGNARPVNYTYEPPAGIPWNSGTFDPQRARSRRQTWAAQVRAVQNGTSPSMVVR